ncbi:MAG: restriction endonuclease [Bdellovibrionota bacterium]
MASKPRRGTRSKEPIDPTEDLIFGRSAQQAFDYHDKQIKLTARRLKLPVQFVATYVAYAFRKMRHPRGVQDDENIDLPSDFAAQFQGTYDVPVDQSTGVPTILLPTPIEAIRVLTPELIERLRATDQDFNQIDEYVFEHLVAELLASQGFSDVRLVGRNQQTSADIFAVKSVKEIDDEIRYFVEVKRHKDRIGVNVIDSVYGAVQNEKEKFGWRASIIVTSYEFKNFKKYTRRDLFNRGIILKDRRDLTEWLDGYKPNKFGLWVPPDQKDLSDL